jgi:hypothetical protein
MKKSITAVLFLVSMFILGSCTANKNSPPQANQPPTPTLSENTVAPPRVKRDTCMTLILSLTLCRYDLSMKERTELLKKQADSFVKGCSERNIPLINKGLACSLPTHFRVMEAINNTYFKNFTEENAKDAFKIVMSNCSTFLQCIGKK